MSSNNPSHQRRPSSNDPPSQISESQILPPRPPPTSSTPTQPSTTPTSSSTTPDPEPDPEPDLPLSMSTSILLASPALPTDARTALATLSNTLDPPTLKVAVRFHAIGSAPQLKQKVFKISASSKFGAVVGFLRKRLYGGGTTTANTTTSTTTGGTGGMAGQQGLFCYVNSVFAPGLDEGVGNLWRCFRTDEQLIVGYSVTPAFG